MNFDLEGFLNAEPLPPSKAVVPLLEAVVNSIHSLQQTNANSKQVTVVIERDESSPQLFEDSTQPITGFQVIDNGIGFNDENLKSFNTCYSTYKQNLGAKGIGRFSWLKAFQSVRIESVFEQGGTRIKRSFDFSISDHGLAREATEETDEPIQTTVHLKGFKSNFQAKFPKKASTIAERVLEHCLAYFILGSAPEIILDDPSEAKRFSVSSLFAEEVKVDLKDEDLEFAGDKLSITHLRRYSSGVSEHAIHLCANDREVSQIRLANEIKALSDKLTDEKGHYFYACYVQGKLLDEAVNTQRTGFHFSQEGELHLEGAVTQQTLIKAVVGSVETFLRDDLQKLHEHIETGISQLVNNKYPEYRALVPRLKPYLKSLPGDPSEDEILETLNSAQLKEDLATRNQIKTILEANKGAPDDDHYKAQFNAYIERVQDNAKARLSQYVIHRRAILQLFRQRLEIDENDKYEREIKIHEVVFPPKATSDETGWPLYNLWIIDERLSFHNYLASDLRVGSGADAASRPDLVVYNRPGAFTDMESLPYSSVTIVEFKRPMRETFTNENPILQVLDYVQLIRDGKANTKSGRAITVTDSTVFQCFIICDFTPVLRKIAAQFGCTPTADEQGYYSYNSPLKVYIELISFDKLLQDSEKRNHVLFKLLGLLPQLL